MADPTGARRKPARPASGAVRPAGQMPAMAQPMGQPMPVMAQPTGQPPRPGMGAPAAGAGTSKPRSPNPPKLPPGATPRPVKAGAGRVPAGQAPPAAGRRRQSGRSAHLRITRVDLLSVLKMSFLFAFCVGIVCFVSMYVLWNVLQSTGVIAAAQSLINSVMGNPDGTTTVQLAQYLNGSRVLGFAAGLSVINVFLLTLLGTLFGALYNLASVMFGGFEVTLEV